MNNEHSLCDRDFHFLREDMFVNQDFLPQPIEQVKCYQCKGILRNPKLHTVWFNSTSICTNSCCSVCIPSQNDPSCPRGCTGALTEDKRLAAVLNNQLIMCPKYKLGCSIQGKMKDGFPLEHEKLCIFREILCTCKSKILVKDLEKHLQQCLGSTSTNI
jgi:hypothetical protein